MFNNFRQPHLPQTHVGGCAFLSVELSSYYIWVSVCPNLLSNYFSSC